ncbi:MAG TPA: hypothetical protein VKU36_01205 [Candidatus Babeliales bacterium]|nr:hypothetical protein [Candidatus Babeliales bacterium]
MKYVLFTLFLITINATLYSMQPITLPPKKVIYDRLYSLGWKDFLKKTKLHKDLGFKNQHPDKTIAHVEFTIKKYNAKYARPSSRQHKKYSTKRLTEKDRAAIIAALFKYHPEIVHYIDKNSSIA